MRPTRRYDFGSSNHRGEVLVVELPKAGSTLGARKRDAKGTRRSADTGLPAPETRRRSPGRKRFDFHPKKFRNYRLIWEMYKSERE